MLEEKNREKIMMIEPLTIEDLLNECWKRECEKVAMGEEDLLLHPTPTYERMSVGVEICRRKLPVHSAVYFFKSTDVLRYALYINQRQAAERVDKFLFWPVGGRNPEARGHYPLGLLCKREPFPDFDDMLAILLLANKKSSSYDEIVTDAIEACLSEIQGRSWETKNKIHEETDPTTMIMVERIKMLMAANSKAGIAVAPRHWYPNSADQSLMYMSVYRLDRPSLLHILLESDAFYLNSTVRLMLAQMFIERDPRVLQWQADLESLLPLQAAIIYGDAKVIDQT